MLRNPQFYSDSMNSRADIVIFLHDTNDSSKLFYDVSQGPTSIWSVIRIWVNFQYCSRVSTSIATGDLHSISIVELYQFLYFNFISTALLLQWKFHSFCVANGFLRSYFTIHKRSLLLTVWIARNKAIYLFHIFSVAEQQQRLQQSFTCKRRKILCRPTDRASYMQYTRMREWLTRLSGRTMQSLW